MAATVKCDTLQNTSSSTANVTLDGSGNATVGNNLTVTGQTIPSSSFKRNRLINGNMVVDQRNAGAAFSVPNSSGYGSCDRWASVASASSVWTLQQVSTGNQDFPYALRSQRVNGSTSTSINYWGQVIETINCQDLAGQSVTFSFYATAGANFSAAGSAITVEIWTGTGTNQGWASLGSATWTGQTLAASQNVTISTTRTRYSITASIGSSVNEIAVRFYYAGVGTAGANDWFQITGAQLETGNAATPYERQIYSDQLAQCQRYYFRQTSAASDAFGVGFNNTTTTAFGLVYYPVIMRTAPTALEQSGTATNYRVRYTGSTSATCSAVPTFGTADTNCALVVFTVASGLTAGQGVTIESNASTAYLGWSAEL